MSEFIEVNDGKPKKNPYPHSNGLPDYSWMPESYGGNYVEVLCKKHPFKCPVCNGKGIVPNGFHSHTNDYYVVTSNEPEMCKGCEGKGIVWG